jgi:hypothetical protein
MAEKLWFKVVFTNPPKKEDKKYYEGFWEGYVAYHDEHIDRAKDGDRHKVHVDWEEGDTVAKVMLNPLDNRPENLVDVVTYTLPSVGRIYSGAASSDPPLPPPPPIRRS